ncbi:MAG: phosphonoacetaldehyde hydrolase [Pseudomonadota bacterium]
MTIFIRNQVYRGPLRAAVLDWAGTAVDYGCIGPVSVFLEVFKRRGVEATLAEARGPMGLMKKDHIRAMCRTESLAERWRLVHGRPPGESDVDEMYPETESLMIASLARHADPIPGLDGALKAFRAAGLKIGSTTGYTRPMVEVLAAEAKRKGYEPDAVVSSSDVPAGRPYPFGCYLNAVKLGVYPLEAMVKIGDTIADIQEGLNAGMWTIGLTKTGNGVGLPEDEVAAMDQGVLRARLEELEAAYIRAGAHYAVEGIGDCSAIIEDINARLARGESPLVQ